VFDFHVRHSLKPGLLPKAQGNHTLDAIYGSRDLKIMECTSCPRYETVVFIKYPYRVRTGLRQLQMLLLDNSIELLQAELDASSPTTHRIARYRQNNATGPNKEEYCITTQYDARSRKCRCLLLGFRLEVTEVLIAPEEGNKRNGTRISWWKMKAYVPVAYFA
jgi:hypothetical protein